jgi:hypothetical protein
MPPGLPPPLPWRVLFDHITVRDYYFNMNTNLTLWSLPKSVCNVKGEHPKASHLNMSGYAQDSGGTRELARDQGQQSNRGVIDAKEKKNVIFRKVAVALEALPPGNRRVTRIGALHNAIGSDTAAIQTLDELGLLKIVPENRRLSMLTWEVGHIVQRLDSKLQNDGMSKLESLDWICDAIGVGKDLVMLARTTQNKFGAGVVVGRRLFNERGPQFNNTKSGPFTHEHCLVIILLVSYGMFYGTDFSAPQIATMMNELPTAGQPIKYLRDFLNLTNNPSGNLLTEEMLSVCQSSPGPVPCDPQQVLRAVHAIDTSDIFPYSISITKRGADDTKLTGGNDESFETSQKARRDFQSRFRLYTEGGVSWDSIKHLHPPIPDWVCTKQWKPEPWMFSIRRVVFLKTSRGCGKIPKIVLLGTLLALRLILMNGVQCM